MAEEQKVNENAGDGNQQQTVNKTVEAGVQSNGTPDGGENQDAKYKAAVTMANAEKEKRQTAEADAQNLRDQIALQPQVPQTTQPEKQASLSQAVAKQLGIDIEIATPEEICQINEGVLQVMSGQQSEQSFINSHPDYAEVVGITLSNGVFQLAAPLSRELKANPALADALRSSPNKAVLAYSIASKDPQYLTELAEKAKSDDTKAAEKAQVAIDAANKQLSINAAKGGGGNLDNAARRAAQTDEEFRKENEQIMAKAT